MNADQQLGQVPVTSRPHIHLILCHVHPLLGPNLNHLLRQERQQTDFDLTSFGWGWAGCKYNSFSD